MQDDNIDTKEVIIEYITDAHGNKVKKIKPLFVKSEPNKPMYNIFLVMTNSLLYQRLISHKNKKSPLIPIVSQSLLVMRQVMIEL